MRLVFVSSGWLRGALNPVKSLHKQTYTTAQRREREQKTTKPRTDPSSFLFTFHWWIWAHDLTYARTTTTTSFPYTCTHTHGCESAQKHCGVHPGPTQPNFPATPIQAACPRRLSYETLPTQAHSKPLTEPQINPAPPPPILSTTPTPRPVNPGLCPEHSPGSQPQPLNEWTRDTGTVGERSRNCSYQQNVVRLICSSRAATRTCHTCRLKSITLYPIYNSYAITLYENTGHDGSLKVNNYTSSSVLFQYSSHL